MTDNGPVYRSENFSALLDGRGIKHKYTKPFNPWQNDKAKRANHTLA